MTPWHEVRDLATDAKTGDPFATALLGLVVLVLVPVLVIGVPAWVLGRLTARLLAWPPDGGWRVR